MDDNEVYNPEKRPKHTFFTSKTNQVTKSGNKPLKDIQTRYHTTRLSICRLGKPPRTAGYPIYVERLLKTIR
jgi:hypothetical protein